MCWACAVLRINMTFYGRSGRPSLVESAVSQNYGRHERTNPSNDSGHITDEIKQQLGDLIKMFKDQKEEVSKWNTELRGEISSLQESVTSIQNQVKESNSGGRKKIPPELSVRWLFKKPSTLAEAFKACLLFVM